MKYKFDAFTAEIENPNILEMTWQDGYGATSLQVSAILGAENGNFGVELGTFDYSSKGTYEDEDVLAWAIMKLEEFKLRK